MESIVLGSVCLFLGILLIIEKVFHKIETDKLTDKLIAKSFVEYANSKHAHEAEITKRKKQEEPKDTRFRNV